MKSPLDWLSLSLLAFGQVKQTQPTQDRNLIVGAWSLNTYELRLLSLQERSRHRLGPILRGLSLLDLSKCKRTRRIVCISWRDPIIVWRVAVMTPAASKCRS